MKIYKSFRRALCFLLLFAVICMGISSLTACSRTPGSDSTELDYATSRYFQALYRIVNKTFHPAVLEEFHQIADALASCVAAHEDYSRPILMQRRPMDSWFKSRTFWSRI